MVSIYVIEMVVEDDIIITHMFLSSVNAYRKFLDLIDQYFGIVDPTILEIYLIKKDIDDRTGITNDTIVDRIDLRKKMDSKVSADKNSEDVHLQE